MEIEKDTLFANVSSMSLQVPQCKIYIGEPGKPEFVGDTVTIPDDYLIKLKGNRPATGKERGFTYMTRACYEKFKGEIQEIVVTRIRRTIDTYGSKAGQYLSCDFILDNKGGYLTSEKLLSLTDCEIWEIFTKLIEKHFRQVRRGTQKYREKLEQQLKELDGVTL